MKRVIPSSPFRPAYTWRVVPFHHKHDAIYRSLMRTSENSTSKYFGELLEAPLLDHFFKGGLTLVLPLSAHPVSPGAIQLGMDETLRIPHVHRTPEEPVHDDHESQHHDSANEARRKWVRP